ncbi:peptide-binding protein [Brevibacillus sp. 179-C9.3 HS]|uniref:peptide-binding protein n=1 Tax=unclassified Brevibacillus TaxID=2684853 RepID=UPI0039A2216C
MKKGKGWLKPLALLSLTGALLVGCSSSNTASPGTATPAPTQKPVEQVAPQATSTDDEKPVDGGTFTHSSPSDIVTINPLFQTDTTSGEVMEYTQAYLYNLDKTFAMTVYPWSIAAELPKVSEDGLTYTVKMKNTAKWSDGKPITADDLVFTINTIINPEAASPLISQFEQVKEVKKLDDYTVEIHMKKLHAPFAFALIRQLVPYHVLKDVPAKDLQAHPYGKDPAKTPTSGPFKWTEWKQKEYHVLDANPDYWGEKKPHIQKVIYKIYADQNTEVQALIKGDVDLVNSIPIPQMEAVKAKEHISVSTEPGPSYEYLAFNFDKKNFPNNYGLFEGQKTRQAISHAINRQGIIDNVLKGTGKLMNAPFLPGTWADPGDAAVHYEYSAEKAKQLLKEDGWVPGTDGILTKDGNRFSFEFIFNSGNSRREQAAVVIQQNLKEVGIEAKPKALDFSALVDQYANPGKFQAMLLGWQLSDPDPDGTTTFTKKAFPPGNNAGWYDNPKLDALWAKGVSTVVQEERAAIYKEVGKEISTNLPYVFMYQYGTPKGMNKRVKFKDADKPSSMIPYGELHGFLNWWIVEEKK